VVGNGEGGTGHPGPRASNRTPAPFGEGRKATEGHPAGVGLICPVGVFRAPRPATPSGSPANG
jgi:hypothetical protein